MGKVIPVTWLWAKRAAGWSGIFFMAKEEEKSDHISHRQSRFVQEDLGALAVPNRRVFIKLCLD